MRHYFNCNGLEYMSYKGFCDPVAGFPVTAAGLLTFCCLGVRIQYPAEVPYFTPISRPGKA